MAAYYVCRDWSRYKPNNYILEEQAAARKAQWASIKYDLCWIATFVVGVGIGFLLGVGLK